MKTLSEVELFLNKINACYEPELNVKGTQKAIQIIEEQQHKIDKAIEYIKKYGLYEELTDYDENDNLIITGVSDEKTTKDLLEILGDGNNE